MKKCSFRENLLKGVASVVGSLIKGKGSLIEMRLVWEVGGRTIAGLTDPSLYPKIQLLKQEVRLDQLRGIFSNLINSIYLVTREG